jgi:PKHD-type hydroxylase
MAVARIAPLQESSFVNLIYQFPPSIKTDTNGALLFDWGGADPFAQSHTLEPNGQVSYPQIAVNAFSPQECAQIVALGEARVKARAAVDDRSDLASRDYRISDIAWIEPQADSHWLYHRLGMMFHQINQAYGFDLVGFVEPLQFTCYGAGQYFGWHADIGGDSTSLRKLSLTIQLSPEGDYDGGALQFHGAAEMPQARLQGTAVAFPSYLAHQVTPVTRGLRRSLVAWAYGPAYR